MKKILITVCLTLSAGYAWGAAQPASTDNAMRAGASRIGYTPQAKQLPSNFNGVLDPI